MLPVVALARHCCSLATNLENYRPLVGDEMTDEIRDLARRLNGVRICHLNATSVGGGVAELLTRYIPLLRFHGRDSFFGFRSIFPAFQISTVAARPCWD
jgi:trehalose synthase